MRKISRSSELYQISVGILSLIRERQLFELLIKAYFLWKRAGLIGMWRKLWWIGYCALGYKRWIKLFDTLDDRDSLAILAPEGFGIDTRLIGHPLELASGDVASVTVVSGGAAIAGSTVMRQPNASKRESVFKGAWWSFMTIS